MSLLYRYLFKEFGLASTFTVGVFVFVLLIGNALKDVLSLLSSGKISGSIFWDVLFHLTPSLVAYAVPLGLLTGTLLVLGKLSSQNEITAMKASGISLFFILRPLLHLALLFTLLSLAVNFYFGPRSIAYYRTCLANLVRKNPLEFIQEGVFVKDFPQYTLYIGSKQSEWIRDCWLWELDPSRPGGVNVFLHAKTGRLRYEKERDVLVLTLFNGKGEQGIEPISHQILFEETSVILPLKEILGRPEVFRRLDYMMWPELWEEYRTVGRSPSARAQKIKIQLEVQERLVMSLATLTFLTVAIPLGIWVGRSETSINLALAVGLAMAYYFSVMAFSWLEGKIDWRPDLLIWLPSLFLSLLGWILLRRLAKH